MSVDSSGIHVTAATATIVPDLVWAMVSNSAVVAAISCLLYTFLTWTSAGPGAQTSKHSGYLVLATGVLIDSFNKERVLVTSRGLLWAL